MLKRSITGLIFGLCMVFGIILNQNLASFLFIIIFMLSSWEWMTHFTGTDINKKIYGIISLVLACLMTLTAIGKMGISNEALFILCSTSMLCIIMCILYTFKILNFDIQPFPWLGGLLYLSLPFLICLIFISEDFEIHKKLILSFIIINWSNDTFAYITGRAIGKTKLAASISPKKTVEGSLGGLLGCIVTGFLLNNFYLSQYFNPIDVLLLAFCIWLFGTTGDLFESRLKRSVDIKDSGNLLPGHGGFMDRFDSFYFMIVAAIYLTILLKF